ncbi:helix-turn-helix domain-containing protein [Xanthobacter sp. V3C-3]|uniref:helix-turn-helix domain-containing protein n=1 Tax=Xanthobacter lutulentifluminis TaxID=3119935 RepID=UPI00372C089F
MSNSTQNDTQAKKHTLTLLDKWMVSKAAMADRHLSASSKNLLFALLDHHNLKTAQCDPSMARLAECIGLSRRRAVAALRELEAAGWVRTSPTCGGRNAFSIDFKKASAAHVEVDIPHDEVVMGRGDENVMGGYDEFVTQTREEETEKRNKREILSPSPLAAASGAVEDSHHPVPEPVRSSRPQIEVDEVDDEFAAFWKQYPRGDDPKAARRAYGRARREGASAADILANCIKYAAERDAIIRERPDQARFTKTAARWLDAGAWMNASNAARPMAPPSDRWSGRGQAVAEVVVRMAQEARAEREAEQARFGGYQMPAGAF